MEFKRILFGMLMAAVSMACIGQSTAPKNPESLAFFKLKLVATMDAGMMTGPLGPTTDQEAFQRAQEALHTLSQNIQPALQQANGHPDLIRATKAFYASATAYFQNVNSVQAESGITRDSENLRLKSDLDAKETEMDLELKLAGMER